MKPNRSSGRESGYDRNRMYGEAILIGDLGFGTHTAPATAQARLIDRGSPGSFDETNTVTITNRGEHYNRLAGQHVTFIRINGELRPL